MDTVTHALSGALLAMALAPRAARPGALSRRARIAAGAAAAAFPDSDFALRAADTLTYLNLHQGVTHSLILMPVWAWLLALLFAQAARPHYRWPAFYGIAVLGIAIHIGGDVVTAYGTQLLAPFSGTRFSWPLLFLIDPYVTAILVAGLVLGGVWPQRRLASLAFVALAAYLGLTLILLQRAIAVGDDFARNHQLQGAVSHALPQPLSPFHWLILVEHGEGYRLARVNLARNPNDHRGEASGFLVRMADGYTSVAGAAWSYYSRFGTNPAEMMLARNIFEHMAFAPFRRFARFLVLDHVESRASGSCVWFSDLRFSLPELPPSFRYGLCRSSGQTEWRLARLPGAFGID